MKIGEVYGNSNNRLLKSISTSGKSMFIDFKKEYDPWYNGWHTIAQFKALIKYKKINFACQSCLDVKKNILISPNHPNRINCSWLITSNFGSYIILNFKFVKVNSQSWVFLVNTFTFNNSLRVELNISRFMKVEVNMQTL